MGASEDSFDWTEDEVAVVDSAPSFPFTDTKVPTQDEAGPSSAKSKLISQFCGMGFSMKMVNKAIKQNGEDNMEAILEFLLAYKAAKEDGTSSAESSFSESEKDGVAEGFSDADSFLDNEAAQVFLRWSSLRERIRWIPDSLGGTLVGDSKGLRSG